MARSGSVTRPADILWLESQGGADKKAKGGESGGLIMRQQCLSTARAKVIKCLMLCVYIRDDVGGIPPNETLLQSNKKMEFRSSITN